MELVLRYVPLQVEIANNVAHLEGPRGLYWHYEMYRSRGRKLMWILLKERLPYEKRLVG